MWYNDIDLLYNCVCVSDYVRLLNMNGQIKPARRHHSIVDMQFEFRIEALGNDLYLNVFPSLIIFWLLAFSAYR